MENVKEILSRLGVETDKADELEKAILANYRTKAEVDSKTARISELEGKLKAAGDAGESESLRKQVEEQAAKLKQLEDEKAEAAKASEAAKERKEFEGRFAEATKGREFANSIVKGAIFDQAFAKAQANPDMDAKAIIDGLTADADGIWKNPQRDPNKLPKPGSTASKVSPITSLDQAEAQTADMSASERVSFYRDHMAEIDKLIKEGK